jgi:hypothetical protein
VRLPALRAGRPLPPGGFLVLISVRGSVDPRAVVRLVGKLKNVTSSGLEPATFRLVNNTNNKTNIMAPLSCAVERIYRELNTESSHFTW